MLQAGQTHAKRVDARVPSRVQNLLVVTKGNNQQIFVFYGRGLEPARAHAVKVIKLV